MSAAMTALEREFSDALEKATGYEPRRVGGEWKGLCPAHPDTAPSLDFHEENDKILVICRSRGCAGVEIFKALDWKPKAIRDTFAGRPVRARFAYHDEKGRELAQKIRFDDDRDPKCMFSKKLDGKKLPLYRLPDVLAAVRDGRTVYIAEGEKDADTLRSLGRVGTSAPYGAATCAHGRGKWLTYYSSLLVGADVVLLQDSDEAGAEHVKNVSRLLYLRGVERVRIIPPFPGPKGTDVSDYLAAHGREATLSHIEKAEAWKPTAGAVPTEDAPDPEEHEAGKPTAEAASDRDGAAKLLIKIGEANSLLFHDERETPHAAIGTDDSRRIVSVKSDTFTTFLSGTFYRTTGRAANSEALTAARRVLSHKAVFDGPRHELHNRFAFHDGAAWIDLANEKQEAVKVTAEGWTVERPPIMFRRFKRQAALPKPATSGDMKKLSGFLNTREDEDALLALVWPVAAMLGHVPRPILDFYGSQGSAKTTAAKMLRRLTDPSVAPTSYLSQKDDELALCLESNAVPLFDNVTHISARQGEILCAAVTGGGFSKRELFTDSDEILYSYRRAIIVTGINVATVAPDLLDRFLLLQLDRIDRTGRLSERALWRSFDAAAPAIFSGMLDALSSAMRLYQGIAEKTVTLERMADFTLWGAAIAEALGFGAAAFFAAYAKNVSAQTEEVLEADPVARAVRELITKRGAWTGTVSELLKLFRDAHGDETKTDGWPKRADGLSRRIRVLEATLAEVGIAVRWSRVGGGVRTRTLTLQATTEAKAEKRPNSPSLASPASLTGDQGDAGDARDAELGYLSAPPVSRLRRSVS